MDIDTVGDGTAHGRIVRVHLTEDNWAEMPDRIKDAFHEAQSCSEILAVLTTIAIQLDRKQMEFQGALREATAEKEAARTELPLCPMLSCAQNARCDFSVGRHCGHRPDTLEHWEQVAEENRKKTIAQAHSLGHLDDEPLGEQKRPYGETFSAFTAVKRHIDVGFVPRPAMEIRDARLEVRDVGDDNAFAGEVRELKERGRDRRNGDRRIFEATCLTANKRNLNREDRRQGERRKP